MIDPARLAAIRQRCDEILRTPTPQRLTDLAPENLLGSARLRQNLLGSARLRHKMAEDERYLLEVVASLQQQDSPACDQGDPSPSELAIRPEGAVLQRKVNELQGEKDKLQLNLTLAQSALTASQARIAALEQEKDAQSLLVATRQPEPGELDKALLSQHVEALQASMEETLRERDAFMDRAVNAEAALTRLRALGEWQPIETCPKERFESVLGYSAIDQETRTMHWDDFEEAWMKDRAYDSPKTNWEPTHWMPLPTPPVTPGK